MRQSSVSMKYHGISKESVQIGQTYINEELEDFLIFIVEILCYSKWYHVGMVQQTNLSRSNDTGENCGLAKLPPKTQAYKLRQMEFTGLALQQRGCN